MKLKDILDILKGRNLCEHWGHVWVLNKPTNRWDCTRCGADLYVSQVDSYRHIPNKHQNPRDLGGFGSYHWEY